MQTSTPEGEIVHELIIEIFKVNAALNNLGNELVKDYGLTSSRLKVMGAIDEAEAPLTVPEIAHEMGLTRQAVQRHVNELISEGKLQKINNPQHARSSCFVFTHKGKKLFDVVDLDLKPSCEMLAQNIGKEILLKIQEGLITIQANALKMEGR